MLEGRPGVHLSIMVENTPPEERLKWALWSFPSRTNGKNGTFKCLSKLGFSWICHDGSLCRSGDICQRHLSQNCYVWVVCILRRIQHNAVPSKQQLHLWFCLIHLVRLEKLHKFGLSLPAFGSLQRFFQPSIHVLTTCNKKKSFDLLGQARSGPKSQSCIKPSHHL